MKENERKLCNEITIRAEKKVFSFFLHLTQIKRIWTDEIRGPVPVDLFASRIAIVLLNSDERRGEEMESVFSSDWFARCSSVKTYSLAVWLVNPLKIHKDQSVGCSSWSIDSNPMAPNLLRIVESGSNRADRINISFIKQQHDVKEGRKGGMSLPWW